MRCCDHLVVGMFSREDRRTYEWLLRIVTFIMWVKEVKPILITNTQSDFTEQVPKCSFGIIYHSKTRGRLNITDVTDSLYDEELQHLFRAYGKFVPRLVYSWPFMIQFFLFSQKKNIYMISPSTHGNQIEMHQTSRFMKSQLIDILFS